MKTYLVGGAVRDARLGRTVRDRDWVVVGASPQQLKHLGFRQVGRDFPVFIHPTTGEDHALARTERTTGPRHADFTCHADAAVTLEEDLRRRDLTINAIAQDGTNYVDPFGGLVDIKRQVLRHVSPAFSEDPLRVFRAARFAAQLTGFTVAPETAALMAAMVPDLQALAGERVWQELAKAMAAPCPHRFFEVLQGLDGADWFADLDLKPLIELYKGRQFTSGEAAIVAVGWAVPVAKVAALFSRLRAPKLPRQASALLAQHGRTLIEARCEPVQWLDAVTASRAFRPGRLADLVLDTAAQCAAVPAEPLMDRLNGVRAVRVRAPSGRSHGHALRQARLDWLQSRAART